MMEQKRLGDIATYINGYAFKPEDRGTEGLPIIRIQDLTGNSYDVGFYNGEYYELQMMKEYFLSQRRGVRQKNLNLGMIKAFKIPIAKRDQQDEFSDFVKQVDKSKVKVQKALDETQKLFDSLMQQYFG